MTQVLELSDRDFKTVVIKMLQQVITNMVEKNEKLEKSQTKRKKKKDTKKNQMRILELK